MSAVIEQGNVETRINDGIATIEFGHPMSNSLPGKILNKLATEIQKAGEDSNVRVILLVSTGDKAFCAGASFDELISIKDFETGKEFFSGFARVINTMRKAPKFVLARVQGKAVGGGVGLAAAADYTFANENAAVKLSELAVGIGPFVVGPAVERKIGTSAFMQLTIDASEWQSAQWAREKGLYTQLFKTNEEMDTAILKLAKTLANSNPEAMAMLKKIFWQGTDDWDHLLIERAGMSGKLVLSDFTVSAINKFKSK
jgi:methylglutaconyl-CoA hydratase